MYTNNFNSKLRSYIQDRHKWIIAGSLMAILALGAFLRFYLLGQAGVNEYYAAAVKSMLVSWKNFFFVAFEPGGSVSVDKPPFGFWIEAVSAYFLGVNGFVLALPNAIAGVLSIFLIYKLICRPFGQWAGLVAALTLAVMPVTIATERNNTIDGMLVLVLLLAAWAFLQTVYTGKARWLYLGAFIVGLGFNIKMLQAFMPLPAFFAIYIFGAKHTWLKKVLHLTGATLLLLIVSFSWAVAVDLTPAANRPYVDSTSSNRVMELIFGHNGIERLTNSRGAGISPGGNSSLSIPSNGIYPTLPGGGGNVPQAPDGQTFPPPPAGNEGRFGQMNEGGQPRGGPGGSMDFGSAGTLRLFTEPLAGEASWLLPFVLGGLLIMVIAFWKLPFNEGHLSAILWAGWLIPEIIYFTYSQGLMHAYYLIMIGGPIAALTGITIWALWKIIQKRILMGWGLTVLLVTITLVFETYSIFGKTSVDILAIEVAGILFSVGIILAATNRLKVRFQATALCLMLAAMLIAPTVWSGLTTFNTSPAGLPAAGPTAQQGMAGGTARLRSVDGGNQMMLPLYFNNNNTEGRSSVGSPGGGPGDRVDQKLLNYLLANTQPGTYLMATEGANSAAPYILATGRPVLTFGGFLDQYDEVSVNKLSSLIRSGELRFVIDDSLNRHQAIAQWVRQNCKVVDSSSFSGAIGMVAGNPDGPLSDTSLYDCGG